MSVFGAAPGMKRTITTEDVGPHEPGSADEQCPQMAHFADFLEMHHHRFG
jgi:hypothetical protein